MIERSEACAFFLTVSLGIFHISYRNHVELAQRRGTKAMLALSRISC
jgi:hypothetical protein